MTEVKSRSPRQQLREQLVGNLEQALELQRTATERATEVVRVAKIVVRGLEWVVGEHGEQCPLCEGYKAEDAGHFTGCAMARLKALLS